MNNKYLARNLYIKTVIFGEKQMKKSFLLTSIILFGAMFMFCGCEILEEAMQESYSTDDPTSEDYEPRFVIGVFETVRYPRAMNLEKEITDNTGKKVWINANPLFSSRRIRAARVVPRPGNPDLCDLEFRIDRMGKTQWQMLSSGYRGEQLAFMVDSRHVGYFVPEYSGYGNAEWVRIRIGMDSYTARGIVKFAKKNFAHFNPDASDWFSTLY